MFTAIKKIFQPARQTEFSEELNLSTAIIETIFLSLLLVLGIHAPITTAAQLLHLPFKVYLIVSPLATLIAMAIAIIFSLRRFKTKVLNDAVVVKWLFFLGLLCSILPLITHHFTTDDYFYVPNAVYYLDHLDSPMDFTIHFFVGLTSDPIISPSQGTSLAYEYFRAVVAYYFHVDYLIVYYLSGVLMGFLLPMAYFLSINRFVGNSKHALIGTLASLSITLVLLEGRSYTNAAFLHAYLGKATALAIGIPLYTAFSFSFFEKPTVQNWIFLFAISTAMVGMTTSTIVLFSILAFVLFGAYILTFRNVMSILSDQKSVIQQVILYISNLGYVFLYSLFLYIMVASNSASFNPFILTNQRDFLGSLVWLSNASFPLTPILMIISILLILAFVQGWQRKFLLTWVVILLTVFLNPFAAKLLIGRFVPADIYWRFFYLIPLPLMIGVTFATLSIRYKIVKMIVPPTLGLALVIFLSVLYYQGILSYSLYKVPLNDLVYARRIARITPPGTMLAPPNLYGLITMVGGFHPQIRAREDGNYVYLNGNRTVIKERQNASRFTGGETKYIQEFESLLKKDLVRTIVLKKILFKTPEQVKIYSILQKYHYINQKSVGDYIIVWK